MKLIPWSTYYIENWSLMLDLFIIAATPLALLKGDNAY
jgi:lipopolysaccharide/colanic/teichoic acid biosynthesis glycosyltransferase